MKPLPDLINGLEVLKPFLGKYGFVFDDYQNGKGSGPQFTIATFKNKAKKFVIGYRNSIGKLDYKCGNSEVDHAFYLNQLGFRDIMRFPDYRSDDKLNTFRNVLFDFELIKADFFEGNCKELKRIAKIQKVVLKENIKKQELDYENSFDFRNIWKARQLYKDKKFRESIIIYGKVENEELLTDFDKSILKLAHKRII